jgi:hypothetical protein
MQVVQPFPFTPVRARRPGAPEMGRRCRRDVRPDFRSDAVTIHLRGLAGRLPGGFATALAVIRGAAQDRQAGRSERAAMGQFGFHLHMPSPAANHHSITTAPFAMSKPREIALPDMASTTLSNPSPIIDMKRPSSAFALIDIHIIREGIRAKSDAELIVLATSAVMKTVRLRLGSCPRSLR